MKCIFYLSLFSVLLLSGCGLQERETTVQKREAELALREQALAEKARDLQLREAEIQNREQHFKNAQKRDSLAHHPANLVNPILLGKWNARMVNTETTCTGSAIGDTKTEIWELDYQNDQVVAKATTGENLIRTYTGTFKNNTLELTENVEPSPSAPATKMVVRLTLLNPTTMEGQREIIRSGDCRIVYSLQLNKQQ
jgi:hypothetical protein